MEWTVKKNLALIATLVAGLMDELLTLTPEKPTPTAPTQKEAKTIRDSVILIIMKWDEDIGLRSMSDEEASALADALVAAGLIVTALPGGPF